MNGLQQNGGVQDEGEVADVVQVVLKLAHGVLQRDAVGMVDLGPAGDAGFYEMSEMIAGDLAFVGVDKFLPFRPGADEAHLASKHVPELRQLVESSRAEKSSDRRDAILIRYGGRMGGGLPHGAKFDENEP